MLNAIEPDVWVTTSRFAYEGRRIHAHDPKAIWLEVMRPAGETHRLSKPNKHFPARIQPIALPWSRIRFAETLDERGRRVPLHRNSR